MKTSRFKHVGTALAVAIIIISNAAQAQVLRKPDRLRKLGNDNILTTGIARAVRPNQAAAPRPPLAPPQVQYKVVDLGENGIGNEIADSGRIVGSKGFGREDRHAALWFSSRGLPIDLGTLADYIGSRGFGVNALGQMVGYS